MDEVEGHPGRGPDEILEPLHESGERTQLHDAEMGLGARGHRLDASPGGTQEQELLDYLRCMPTPILVEACVDSIESALAAARTASSCAPTSSRAARRPPRVRSRSAGRGSTSRSSCSSGRAAETSST